MKKFLIFLCTVALIAAVTTPVTALPTNLGFEEGNLSGWFPQNHSHGAVVSSYTASAGTIGQNYSAPFGDHFYAVEGFESDSGEIWMSMEFEIHNTDTVLAAVALGGTGRVSSFAFLHGVPNFIGAGMDDPFMRWGNHEGESTFWYTGGITAVPLEPPATETYTVQLVWGWWVESGSDGYCLFDAKVVPGARPLEVPEPFTLLLVGIGLGGLAWFSRRQFRK